MFVAILPYILAALAVAGAAFIGGFFWRVVVDRKYKREQEEQLQKKAELILKEAKNEAEIQKKTAILEAKDEWFKAKT
ncbi:MAG: Rnase Y domain-containing protein, partial [Chitinispirillales bacterium]|nr:Rnase Y domain-containing protein [Chitinispirillales bacterium]